MASRRKLLLHSILLLFVILAGAIFYVDRWWQAFKEENSLVEVEISDWHLSANGLYLKRLRMVQEDAQGRSDLELNELLLGINHWWAPLPLQSLRIGNLDVTWQPADNPDGKDADKASVPVPSLDLLEGWAGWIPHRGRIDSFEVHLPCHTGVCHERGSLEWTRSSEKLLPVTVQLQVVRAPYGLTLKAHGHREDSDVQLALDMQLGGQQRLSLLNRFSPEDSGTLWHGALAMSELPEADWLQRWLGEWLPYQVPDVMELPSQMHLGAAWTLAFDPDELPASLEKLSGDLRLSMELPLLWPVPGIGLLQGHLDLAAHAEQGAWIPTELAADLQLQPDSALFAAAPASVRPEWLRLIAGPGTTREDDPRIALDLQIEASGPAAASLDARVLMETTEPYGMTVEQARLLLEGRHVPEMNASGLAANLLFSGQLSPRVASLRLGKGSQITLESLDSGPELVAEKLRLDLSGLDITVHPEEQSVTFAGPLQAETGQLRQPSLRPQGWRWRATLDGNQERVTLKGPLENDAGLKLDLDLRHSLSEDATRLNIQLPELFLRAGNPLAATLVDWPSTLELNTGNLQAQGQLTVTGGNAPHLTGTLQAKGLGGIFDRTELSGLDAQVSLSLKQDRLQVEIPELSLQQANPGILLGPLWLQAQYSANLHQVDQGRLTWSTAELQVLGGRLWLSPDSADLSAPVQQLSVHLRDLPLASVLEAYPTEGLAGTGIIDGELHFQRSEAGVSIDQGTVQARQPGGTLQFRSAKIQAMGQANPAMRLVAQALDDFRYDVLTSDVRYATDGTLNLGLRLHGHNPALEGGRPINLSVNLEEDIPALLTSLQLSDRVSETIQRRVQERIRKRAMENGGQ